MVTMELTDILSVEGWGEFEKDLYDRFGINCCVFRADGTGVTGKPNWCNALCPIIKANPESLAMICAPGNQYFMARAEETRGAVVGECDAGMIKIAVPIFSDALFLGTAGGCGLLPENGEIDTFMVHKATGMDEEEIAGLCEGLGTMSPAKAEEMAAFIQAELDRFLAHCAA